MNLGFSEEFWLELYDRMVIELWMVRLLFGVIIFRIAGGPNLIRALWRKRNSNAGT